MLRCCSLIILYPTTLLLDVKGDKKMRVICGTNTEREKWINDFNKTKEECEKNRQRLNGRNEIFYETDELEIALKRSQEKSNEVKSRVLN